MTVIFALLAYVVSITIANLLVVQFGPAVTPINAFVLIGLDLTLRDWLHVRIRPWQMGTLIVMASAVTWWLNPAAQTIAIASAVSFGIAALADWLVFAKTGGSWHARSFKSNLAGAAVDSVLFPTLAFGALLPVIVLSQFAAKVGGGVVWAFILTRFKRVAA